MTIINSSKEVMKIFVPKNKIMAMSNPEFFFSKLTLIRRACCVYIKLIERPGLFGHS